MIQKWSCMCRDVIAIKGSSADLNLLIAIRGQVIPQVSATEYAVLCFLLVQLDYSARNQFVILEQLESHVIKG